MPKIYYNLIIKREKKLSDVPEKDGMREKVKKLLIENEYEHLI